VIALVQQLERKDARDDFEVKRLARPFTVKALDDQGTFEGHGAVFNVPHQTSSFRLPAEWQDRILPGAFGATLAEHKRRGTLPVMLYMHERGNVIGAWREMEEDADGLRVKGQIEQTAKAPSGATLYGLLKMGALNAMSIGFAPTKVALDEKKKIRDIQEVELGELSIVDIPGNGSARITDVKGANPALLKRKIEEALRDAGLSREEAKAFIADGFKALRDAVAEEEETHRTDVKNALRDAAASDDVIARIKAAVAEVRSHS
jgi:HK97 family phage prohead protease